MKTEEAFLKAPLQPLLFEALEDKTHVLEVFVMRATVDTYVVEIDNNIVVKSRAECHSSFAKP
jgi:hypothetical protein